MSLSREALDQDKDNDKFFQDGKAGPLTIAGEGQMVYWKASSIQVYKTGHEDGPPSQMYSTSDGQALVKRGTSLIFEGGKIKEV
ncbi:hypothetical protein V2G26_017329 [Clonostachys chloroleuca]